MIRSLLLLALSLPITGSLRTCPPPQTTSEGAVTATGIISDQDGAIVIEGAFDRFTTDEMGNVYALKGDELMLFDKEGAQFMRNSVKTFGRITQIDAFYSLKPMVFSAEQGMLAVLDNTLSVQGSVIEIRRNFPQVVLAAMSVQNHFWLFDERELSIIRVDRQLRPISDTGRLDQLLGFTPTPVSMQEYDSWLYVNDPRNGLLVFDLFGTYGRTIPITGAKSFEVRGNEIFFFKDDGLHVYDMRSFTINEVPLPGAIGGVNDARVENGRIYMHLPDRIVIAPARRQP